MDINTILTNIRNGVADDSATKVWTQATYAKDHKVFVGIDLRDPPRSEYCPDVSIYPLKKSSGDNSVTKDHHFGVGVRIYDDTQATPARANIVEFNGVQRVESFRKLVETAIVTAVETTTHLFISEMEVTYEAVRFFPYFLAEMEFTAQEPRCLGESAFT